MRTVTWVTCKVCDAVFHIAIPMEVIRVVCMGIMHL